MKHGSLFSGIGGFDLAASWMGWENVFHCEWNKFGQQVLKHHFPNSVSYDDICKTDFTLWRGKVDIISGGFPCQPYSMAGKRKGTEDSRHLWPEMLRAIRECQPTWIVGENVPGLINWSKGLVFEQVCADLEGEGYEVQPIVLPASGVNAPHRRDRVWFVAYRNDTGTRNGIGIDGIWQTENERRYGQPQLEFGEDGNDGTTPNPTSQRINGINGINGINRSEKGDDWKRNDELNGGSDGSTQNTNGNGRDGIERKEQSNIGRFGDIGTGDNERVRADNEQVGVFTYSDGFGLRGQSDWIREPGEPREDCQRNNWTDFPTQSPICGGDDGIPRELDGITFPKWRNESIKGYGNAIVPQVAYQIFKVIDEMNKQL